MPACQRPNEAANEQRKEDAAQKVTEGLQEMIDSSVKAQSRDTDKEQREAVKHAEAAAAEAEKAAARARALNDK